MSNENKTVVEVVKTDEKSMITNFHDSDPNEVFKAFQVALIHFTEATNGNLRETMDALDAALDEVAKKFGHHGIFKEYDNVQLSGSDILRVYAHDENQLGVNFPKNVSIDTIIAAINVAIFCVAQETGTTVDDVLKKLEKNKVVIAENRVDINNVDGNHIS